VVSKIIIAFDDMGYRAIINLRKIQIVNVKLTIEIFRTNVGVFDVVIQQQNNVVIVLNRPIGQVINDDIRYVVSF